MDALVVVLAVLAAVLTLALIVFGVVVLLRTRKHGRTADGKPIMSAQATVVRVRKLRSGRDADRELVLKLHNGLESTIVASAVAAAPLRAGHQGVARWADGRLIDFTHQSKSAG